MTVYFFYRIIDSIRPNKLGHGFIKTLKTQEKKKGMGGFFFTREKQLDPNLNRRSSSFCFAFFLNSYKKLYIYIYKNYTNKLKEIGG